MQPHRRQPTRLPRPWDSPGKNTGVGCRFFLQCMKVKSESEVAQSCLTLSNPMDCSLSGSSVHGIFQARVLEWVPLPSPLLLASPISLLEFLTSGHLCLEWALDFVVYIWCLFRKLFPIFCWGCSECVSLRMLYLHFRLLCWMVRATAVRLLFFTARRSPSSLVICVLAFVGCRLNSFAVSTSLVPCNSSVA